MGYFDLQVNGYGGVDFNQDALRGEGLTIACQRLLGDGVEGALATIITDRLDLMAARLRRLVELREYDESIAKVIQGIHIEGPFLNEATGYRGAHPADAIRPADVDAMQQLLEAAGGLTRMVTLAPERDPDLKVTAMLAKRGIAVSAGHCDPTLHQLSAAVDAGLSMFTHLGNGCPMQLHRHDNVIQRALSLSDRLWITFIADGVHIPFFAMGNYLKCAGIDRAVVVTDAMAAAGLGPGRYRLARWEVEVGEDGAAWAPDRSHLVGSAMTMTRAAANLSERLGLDAASVRRLTRDNPRKALRI